MYIRPKRVRLSDDIGDNADNGDNHIQTKYRYRWISENLHPQGFWQAESHAAIVIRTE